MASFCIPKKLADELKQAAREGVFDIAKMFEMSSEERRALFEPYVDKAMAKQINAGFERAMVSESTNALKSWAEKTFQGPKQKAKLKTVLEKINELNDGGVFNPRDSELLLEDLVAEKLGATVTKEEIAELTKRADHLAELDKKRLDDGTNNPSDEYLKARDEMNQYIDSLTPGNRATLLIHQIGRGNMLFQSASSIMNITANSLKAAHNRVDFIIGETADSLKNKESVIFRGDNRGEAYKLAKADVKRYIDTGYSFSRTRELDEGQKVLGENSMNSQGKGAIRAVARWYDKVVFRMTQGVPDIVVASAIHYDTMDFLATKAAHEEGYRGAERKQRSLEILHDAASLEPKTEIGQSIREESIQNAEDATNTQKSAYVSFALGLRNLADNAAPRAKIGTSLVPFVKTPANAVGYGIDAAGVKAIEGVIDFITGKTKKSRKAWKDAVKKISRSAIPIMVGILLYNYVKKDSVQGDYDPKRQAIRDAENVGPNSITFIMPWGEKNISTDYLGPIATVLHGLQAAEGSKNFPDALEKYSLAVSSDLTKIPGVNEFNNVYDAFDQAGVDASSSKDKIFAATTSFISNFIVSRTIPAFVTNIAKATDPYERKPEKGDIAGAIMARIPGLRQTQPIKTTATGKKIETESAVTTLLFGSRVKTPINDPIVNEYNRLAKQGITISFTDLENPQGNLGDLKAQLTKNQWNDAKDFYRQSFVDETTKVMKSSEYKALTLDDKQTKLTSAKEKARQATLDKYKFKKSPKAPKRKDNGY